MNYYDYFGLSPTASTEDINTAHKALAKKYHPDINSSNDAHEKMTKLNEAHEILSDNIKRERYDKEQNLNQRSIQNRDASSSQVSKARQSYGVKVTDERAEKAELLRRKAEAKIKNGDALRAQRMEREQQRNKKDAQNSRQVRADVDKQQVLKVLSSLVMDGNIQLRNNMDIDEERHNATKVLLSMVRNDNEHLRRRAEEAERKQRIDEILTLVKEYNSEKE